MSDWSAAVCSSDLWIASLAAIAALVAAWTEDTVLSGALDELPERLAAADAFDWLPAIAAFAGATNLFVLGRAYGRAAVQEAALKFKATCALHAEAVSAAEVRHGPMAIIGERFSTTGKA